MTEKKSRKGVTLLVLLSFLFGFMLSQQFGAAYNEVQVIKAEDQIIMRFQIHCELEKPMRIGNQRYFCSSTPGDRALLPLEENPEYVL